MLNFEQAQRTMEEVMCAFKDMVDTMEADGQWKSYNDGSIFDVYGNEILPKAEVVIDHHRFEPVDPNFARNAVATGVNVFQ